MRIARHLLLLLLVALAVAGGMPAAGQLTARRAFMLLPDSLLDLLPAVTRRQMVDSFAADTTFEAVNALGGRSRMLRLDSTYARVCLTPVSNIEIKILPLAKGDCVVGMSYTIEGPEPDSELFFFDSRMRPLALGKIFRAPALKDYFRPLGKKKLREIETMMPFPTIAYTFSPEDDVLTSRLTSAQGLPRESRDSIEEALGAPVRMYWQGGRFRVRH